MEPKVPADKPTGAAVSDGEHFFAGGNFGFGACAGCVSSESNLRRLGLRGVRLKLFKRVGKPAAEDLQVGEGFCVGDDDEVQLT